MTDIAEYMRQGGPCIELNERCKVMDAASGCACAKAAAEIERLSADNLRLYELGKKWIQERSGQRKEIERLRAALREITDRLEDDFAGKRPLRRSELDKARAALEERT